MAQPAIELTDGRERLKIKVTRTDTTKTLATLGQEEVEGEGFTTKNELEADLRQYYRDLRPETPLTVIWFEALN